MVHSLIKTFLYLSKGKAKLEKVRSNLRISKDFSNTLELSTNYFISTKCTLKMNRYIINKITKIWVFSQLYNLHLKSATELFCKYPSLAASVLLIQLEWIWFISNWLQIHQPQGQNMSRDVDNLERQRSFIFHGQCYKTFVSDTSISMIYTTQT